LTALGAGGATTTYGYDAFGQRVFQTGTTTTYLYPFKWYSVASSTDGGAKFATTTDYVFNGDSLVATVDQQTASGNATGTAKTRYIHPDHLGSTNVVTDENDNVVQTLDYYPYGSTRISSATSTNERRKFIGQFTDDSTLSYLNARYYDGARGQFNSEDPVFWGDQRQQDLQNPQNLNSYSYAIDNPITREDPTGKCIICAGAELAASLFAQRAFDQVYGPSSPAVYGGDVVGGAIYGFAYPYAVAFPEPVAAVAAAAGNATQQGLEYLSGDRSTFDPSQVQVAGTSAFGVQFALGSLPIPIISAGPLQKQIATKLQKGIISNVSGQTLNKIAISNVPGSFVGNFATNYVQGRIGNANVTSIGGYQGISTALSMSQPGSSVSLTISLAKAAIQLAQVVIAAYKGAH
jgi:RHS repeat-associated protein